MRAATVKVTHACGHETSHRIYFANNADRDRKVAWMSKQDCPECERAAENAASASANAANGLPALTGSEKQIAWAETIRQKLYKELESTIVPEYFKMYASVLFTSSDSKFWIDNRGMTIRDLAALNKDAVAEINNKVKEMAK